MSQLNIRIADVAEHSTLNARYKAWGYDAPVEPDDVLYVAELGREPVGLVRRTRDNGTTMLRGMYVDPAHHRERIGSALLARLVKDLEGGECYCIPFSHLTRFYAAQRFEVISDADAPAFLAERTRRYRAKGHDVLIMRRLANEVR